MKNVLALVSALALAATTTATAIVEDGWGEGGWGTSWGNGEKSTVTSFTTFTTDVYTTYCPSPTTLTYGTQTYTVTKSQTLTITECP